MKSVWRGTKAMTETPDSGDWSYSDVAQITRIFNGPYDVLLASAPQRGSAMAGFAGCTVVDIKLKKAGGG